MAFECWLKSLRIKQQGSALLMVLGLLTFMSALGSIVFRAAQMREELARERYAYRKAMNVLESITTAACAAGAPAWRIMLVDHPDTTDIGSYSVAVEGMVCHLGVVAEQGELIMLASCGGRHGTTIVLKTRLGFDDEQAVIRDQKRVV